MECCRYAWVRFAELAVDPCAHRLSLRNVTFFIVIPTPDIGTSGTLIYIPGPSTSAAGNMSGLDWTPSIGPGQNFVIVASDARGTGSGGLTDGTTQSADMVCAFGVSDQYSVMQRCLFYLLLTSGLLLYHCDWLTGKN
jgi:hypothetical protein